MKITVTMKYFFIVMLFFPASLLAQKKQKPVDSMLNKLPGSKDDTNKINLLAGISFEYRNINSDEGIKYGQQSLELAIKLSWKKGIANAYRDLGINYDNKADYTRALEYCSKAENIFEEMNYKRGIAAVSSTEGNIY